MPRRTSLLALARSIDPGRAEVYALRLGPFFPAGSDALEIAILLSSAYPALAPAIEASPAVVKAIAAEGYHAARSRSEQLARLRGRIPDISDTPVVVRELRRAAQHERI